MGDLLFPRHARNLRMLCEKVGLAPPLEKESLKVAFIRFIGDKSDVTILVKEENVALMFFFQELVPGESRYNGSQASYIRYTDDLRSGLVEFFAELAFQSAEVRMDRFPGVAEAARFAEIFWKDESPESAR